MASATRSANLNLTISLAEDRAGTGISSNAVSPGLEMTRGVEARLTRDGPQLGIPADDLPVSERFAVKNMVPNPGDRPGRSEAIAAAVASLASPLTGYINGANLRMVGGTGRTMNL
jgi:NAD(P)-dependent dehydrogenase (short-subunit alcohol dehydrogenase family)